MFRGMFTNQTADSGGNVVMYFYHTDETGFTPNRATSAYSFGGAANAGWLQTNARGGIKLTR